MIDLKKLIKATAFPDELKQQLLTSVDSFSPEKKFELENICWDAISSDFHNKLDLELQTKTLDASMGGSPLSREDISKIEEDAYRNLVNSLEAVEDKEKIDEIAK